MASNMRAKVRLTEVQRFSQSEKLRFTAVCKPTGYPADGADEDNTYAKFSPSATFEITVANPALLGQFNPDEVYYVDFTPVK